MKKERIHMIGNSYLDPVWMWQWYDGYHQALFTFRSALDRMNEYPGFIFTACSAAFYNWVEETDPAMFEEIRERVKEGRWVLAGGWWIQPDCNIPSGESFVRHALYSQRYFYEKFGKTARTGYNVDSFGHNAGLPQILKKSGIEFYNFVRPSAPEKGLPADYFLWRSPDGSTIPCYRLNHTYGSGRDELSEHLKTHLETADSKGGIGMCFYGIGNHGGGPTKANIESIMKMQKDDSLPELIFSSPDAFFEEAAEKIPNPPVVADDLFHHASGCYSSHSAIKKYNRKSEYRLLAAEALSVMAKILTQSAYPADISLGWKNVLFNQFHDTMGGTSIKEAYDDADEQQKEAISIASKALNKAAEAIAWRIDTPQIDGSFPLVVFNPSGIEGKIPVSLLPVELPMRDIPEYRLVDDKNKEIPFQENRNEFKSTIQFMADMEAYSYKTYWLLKEKAKKHEEVKCDRFTLDNGLFRLEISPETGFIEHFTRKSDGAEFIRETSCMPKIMEDRGDTWGHRCWVYDDRPVADFQLEKIELIRQGEVSATVRAEYTAQSSRVAQEFTMYKDIERVDVKVISDWHEKNRMLKIFVRTPYINERLNVSLPFSHIQRPVDGVEFPMHEWLDISGAGICEHTTGLSVFNDAKYSYGVRNNIVGITVQRSPIFAQHDPTAPEKDKTYTYMDQGVSEFTYALYPHDGTLERSNAVADAILFNSPYFAMFSTYHSGNLPQSGAFMTCSHSNIVFTALKNAEDGGGFILRAYESSMKAADGLTIDLPLLNRTVKANFSQNEIKTFYVPYDNNKAVYEVNLIEME